MEKQIHAIGPFGLLVQAAIRIGALSNEDFCLWQAKEEPISLLEMPYQHLACILVQAAARARTSAAKGIKATNQLLREMDTLATNSSNKVLLDEEIKFDTPYMYISAVAMQGILELKDELWKMMNAEI